jgi:DNA-binding SARP family transcriptional activator
MSDRRVEALRVYRNLWSMVDLGLVFRPSLKVQQLLRHIFECGRSGYEEPRSILGRVVPRGCV